MNTQQRMTKLSTFCLLGLLGLTLSASQVAAQVFETGPDDQSLFDNLICVPADPNIVNGQSFGGDGSTTQINVSAGGTIGSSFDANSGSEINIRGGSVGILLDAFSGSEINISAGSVAEGFDANTGSVVNISGGSVAAGFDAFSGSVVNISGGSVGIDFDALPGSQVNLFGSAFAIDGESLEDELTEDEAFTIEAREVILSGVYDDGTEFSFDLNLVSVANEDFFSTGATLTVTLGSQPGLTAVVLGDINGDDAVDLLDIAPFIEALTTNSFLEAADANQDCKLNFLDIAPFIALLSAG